MDRICLPGAAAATPDDGRIFPLALQVASQRSAAFDKKGKSGCKRRTTVQ
jgi:hypothetical protein